MSYKAVQAAIQIENIVGRDKLVLIALADFMNDRTRKCFPSVASIMKKASLSKSSVLRSLKNLEAQSLIKINRQKNLSNSYELLFFAETETHKLQSTENNHLKDYETNKSFNQQKQKPVSAVEAVRIATAAAIDAAANEFGF